MTLCQNHIIETQEFASGAEAVAHYANLGFHSKGLSAGVDRVMVNDAGDLEVVIFHVAFMEWRAIMISA